MFGDCRKYMITNDLRRALFGLQVATKRCVRTKAEAKNENTPTERGGGEEMSLAYDLFERLPDGQPMWVKAVASVDDARALIGDLVDSHGRAAKDFFVYDVRRGAVVAVPDA
jgi:hypothetical protein